MKPKTPSRPLRIPIRFKILVSLLFVVTAVVSAITFTMANLFHQDKGVYISDIVSTVAVGAAEETRSTLGAYADRLRFYARVIGDHRLDAEERTALTRGMFEDFAELVAVYVYRDGSRVADAHNAAALEQARYGPDALAGLVRELEGQLGDLDGGRVHVGNASLPRLPALWLAIAGSGSAGERTVLGIVRADSLLRISERVRAAEVFVVDGSRTLLAHPDTSLVARRATLDPGSGVEGATGSRGTAVAREIERDGVPTIGAYADAGIGDVLAGAEIPRSAAFLASRVLLRRLLLVALLLLLLSAVVGLVWAHRVTRPVETLSRAAERIGQGDFDIEVHVRSRDEIGALADSFNAMACGLNERDVALLQAQEQLLQSEKMAAFGQLGAGIAHEVKNPLAGILGCAQLALRKVEEGTPTHANLKLIEKETRRCKTIIENLLKFARQEKAEFQRIDLRPVVEDAVAIVRHQLELKRIHVRTEVADTLPSILGNANQLQQVLVNLLVNAGQAMDESGGEVTVTANPAGPERVEIRVRDNGPGMTPEIRARLFEPFFTTKPGGKGTGLGLSVSFGIVEDHKGSIEVDSAPGEGATFRIMLPVEGARSTRARTA